MNEALLHNWFYGNYGVRAVAAVTLAYFLASIPLGSIVGWLFAGLDARIVRVVSFIVPVANAMKGFLATVIAFHGGGAVIGSCAGVAACLGHYFCPWRRFRGERDIDLVIGILAAVDLRAAGLVLLLWLVCYVTSRSRTIATLAACAFLFLPLWYFRGTIDGFFGAGACTVIVARLGARHQTL